MRRVVSREELGKEAWDAAVAASAEAWLWHRYDVCEASVRDWPGRRDHSFAVVSDGGEVEAIVPAFALEHRLSLGLRIRYLNSVGGPAIAGTTGKSRTQETLDAVVAELRRLADLERAIKTTISLPTMAPALRGPDGPRCNPLLHLGCRDVSGQNWISDAREGADAIWKRFHVRARRHVRSAQAEGVCVRPAGEQEWVAFFELHKVTYRRLGVPPYPSALFRVIFERLIPAGMCHVLFAEWNGEIVAAQNIACYKQGAYYWHGFASEAGLRLQAMTLLTWEGIRALIGKGLLDWFDMSDAVFDPHDEKMRQLSHFKRGFGGSLYPAFRGQFDGTNKFYNRLRHLRGLITGE